MKLAIRSPFGRHSAGARRALHTSLGQAALAQQRPQQDGAKGRGTDATEREAAELQRVVARAQHQRDGGDDEVAVVGKSTLLSTQILAPATAMSPNTTMDTPPITASGMAWISAPNLGLKPSRMAIRAATTKVAVE